MATDVTMPRLSDSMEEGTILKWIVEEGGEVKRGEPLCEIETDKANMTYEADTDGTLIEIVVQEGDTVALGEVIARVGDADEAGGSGSDEDSADEEEPDEEEPDEDEEEPDDDSEADEDDSEAEDDSDEDDSEESGTEEEEPAEEQEAARASSNGSEGDERAKASPVARRVANELGIDIADVAGTGPGGRILKADVEKAAEEDGGAPEPDGDGKPAKAEKKKGKKEKKAKKKAEAEEKDKEKSAATEKPEEPQSGGDAGNRGEMQVQELTRLQRTVSRRMAESKATAPDFSLEVEIDMSLCVELRARLKEVEAKPPSYNDMVVKACANALREHPRVNAAYRDGKFELYSRVNVGVAVAANDALVVPTVFDADKKSLGEISRTVQSLATKVRDSEITPPELSGGTFTVSNLGMYGIDRFTAVINPPQAALLAVGALRKRPMVDDGGRIVARDTMSATLVCDHRILYGADGAKFLARVRELLEQPLSLAL
jgi:pyruvate dehydrogenase E2 component (dihydrolipoamide acetyltransferase)